MRLTLAFTAAFVATLAVLPASPALRAEGLDIAEARIVDLTHAIDRDTIFGRRRRRRSS
jgi:hypothetical protein